MNNLTSVINGNLSIDGSSIRLFHGRGKKVAGLEHVTIDFYPPTVLITLYKETSPDVMNTLLESIALVPSENILVQNRYLQRPSLDILKGSIPSNATALERGSKYYLKFGDTQNIGFFLDMSTGREMLERISNKKKVLNLFSYTCSLSVAALKGEASAVVNIDMSKAALSVGESNHILNNLDLRKSRFLSYDIMKSWNKIFKHGPYDIVVIDPPTNQGDSFKVERDYYKIVKRLKEMTNDEAVILACLNSPYLTGQFIIDLFNEHAPEYKFQEIIYSAFNLMEENPEEGLKIVVFKKLS
ncbi:MAG: class I SAM-dependent methyltransferase [Bacteriovorax sp.]|nr:class I SAM-dependent methyltransferase [Bacteriovorax sp.]